MSHRPLTLFTGQWADLPLATLAPLARKMGYDGLELACWGDHFDIDQALADPAYIPAKWQLLADHGLTCHALSNHLLGQAICDNIDERHKSILPPRVWGDGDPESVRRRAAQAMITTAQAARAFFNAKPTPGSAGILPAPPPGNAGVPPARPPLASAIPQSAFRIPHSSPPPATVNGFTGSSIWHSLYAFPPTTQAYWQKGYDDFAARFLPILDAFDKHNVNFALEVHPTEIAFDTATARRALDAVRHHPRFGFNYDPSHLAYQGVDYIKFLHTFPDRIYHVHIKDVWWNRGDGTTGVFGGHTDFATPSRHWDFRSPGRGDIDFEAIIVALNDIHYTGPLSVEWEDGRMDRVHGATEAAALVRRLDFPPSQIAFDSAFERK